MLFTTLASISQNKFNKLVDIIAMVNLRSSDKLYIFHNIQIYANGKTFIVKAMIDTGIIYNLIA